MSRSDLPRSVVVTARPTMRDVAQAAGVSVKTVSRVVNSEAGVTVELAGRVRDAIEQLGYRPDVSASSLRRSDRRTGAVGVAVDDVSNPFSSAVLRGVEDVARATGTVVFSASLDLGHDGTGREHETLHSFVARRVDGIILMPPAGDLRWLGEEVMPFTRVVAIDRRPRGVVADTVLSTNTLGAAEAVRHLLEHGHRDIAYLGDREWLTTARERHDGYEQALAGAGVPPRPDLVHADVRGEDAAESCLLGLMTGPQPPTAVFAAQNLVATGVIRGLQRLGRQHDVAMVAFDDVPLGDLLRPGLTVVAQDARAIGREAARLLLSPRAPGDAVTVQVPTRLLRRGSGEIRAVPGR